MADFSYWGEAVGRGLGWPEQSFRSAYARNRRVATDNAIDESAALMHFSGSFSSLKWSGLTVELHVSSRPAPAQAIMVSSRWPKHVFDSPASFVAWHPSSRLRLPLAFSRSRDQRLISLTYDNDWAFRHPHRNHHGA